MTDARANRGTGNGKNKNWYNSPLWDAIEKKKEDDKKKEFMDKHGLGPEDMKGGNIEDVS